MVVGAKLEDSSESTITNGTTSSASDTLSDSGAVYIYTRSGSSWSQQAYIKASNSSEDDQFGSHVSISHHTLAVASPLEDEAESVITNGTTSPNFDGAADSGAVYIYHRDGSGSWQQQAYIKAVNSESLDLFGSSISLQGNELAVGAPMESENLNVILNAMPFSTFCLIFGVTNTSLTLQS